MSAISAVQLEKVALTEKIVIPSQPAAVQRVQEELEGRLRAHGYEDRDIFCICTALEEAVTNAIKHGNQLDASKSVHVSYHVCCERCDIQIEDEGNGFNPHELPDPTDPENLERCCGRGVFMMKHFMSHVEHNARGNLVRMCKVREAE